MQQYEPQAKELAARSGETVMRIRGLLATLHKNAAAGRRAAALASELAELLRNYPKWRLQAIILQRLNAGLRLPPRPPVR